MTNTKYVKVMHIDRNIGNCDEWVNGTVPALEQAVHVATVKVTGMTDLEACNYAYANTIHPYDLTSEGLVVTNWADDCEAKGITLHVDKDGFIKSTVPCDVMVVSENEKGGDLSDMRTYECFSSPYSTRAFTSHNDCVEMAKLVARVTNYEVI
tara:strand:- start:7457 stop:7915 length:459 start_codon:yes stop_codon:yes gene_type:complete